MTTINSQPIKTSSDAATEVKLNIEGQKVHTKKVAKVFSEGTVEIFSQLSLDGAKYTLNAAPAYRKGANGKEYVFLNVTNEETGENLIYVGAAQLNKSTKLLEQRLDIKIISSASKIAITPDKLPAYCAKIGITNPWPGLVGKAKASPESNKPGDEKDKTSPEPKVGGLGQISASIDLGPTGSLQFQFAKLQLALSQTCKEQALAYIKDIQEDQERQKQVSDLLSAARAGKQAAKDKKGNAGKNEGLSAKVDNKSWEFSAEQVKLVKNLGLGKIVNADKNFRYSADESEAVIEALKAKADELSSGTQQKMVFVQDFMGQYNSYLQGANSSIQSGNQTLTELARVR